jgi:hypothetical protein
MWTGSPSQNLGLAIWPRVTQDLGQLAPLAPLFYGPLFGRGFRIGTASSTCSGFRVGRRPFAIDASRAGASWSILLQSIRCLCPAHRHQFAGLECFRLLGTPALEPRWGEGWSKRAYGPTVQDATTRSFQKFPIIYLRTKNPFEASASPCYRDPNGLPRRPCHRAVVENLLP